MGIFNYKKSNTNQPSIDLTDYKFLSDDHTRVQNGLSTDANNKGAWRGIRIQTSDNITFYVTMYNINENHPVWGDNIQMAEKQMKLIEEKNDKIILRGYGIDTMGSSFADYGLTLHKSNEKINKISLHMHDRNIEIIYEKAEDKKQIEILNYYSDFDNFKNFAHRWNVDMPMDEKMRIAMQSDLINNQGAYLFKDGDLDSAIQYFEKALKLMPINDDALKNLIRCHNINGNYENSIEPLKKLYYLSPNLGKNKIIAYSLLLHLIEYFDYNGAAVAPSTLIDFIDEKFNIKTNDSEIKQIIAKINEPYNRDILTYFLGGGFIGSGESSYLTTNGTTKTLIMEEIGDI